MTITYGNYVFYIKLLFAFCFLGVRRRIPNPLFPRADPEEARGEPHGAENEAQSDKCEEDEDKEDVNEEAYQEEDESYERALKLAEKESLKDLEDRIYSKAAQDLLKLPKPGAQPGVSCLNKKKAQSTDVSNQNTRNSSR